MAARVRLPQAPGVDSLAKASPKVLPLAKAPAPAPKPPGGGLATANAPPLRLPGEHFVAAFTSFVIGTVLLAVVAPELAAGAFVSTHVVAVVHLFTLGFISTSIFGALYQFLPVAVDTPIRSQRLAHVTFALLVLGIPTFLLSFLYAPSFLPVGAGAVALAFALFAGNFIATLAASKERTITWWALVGAATFLVVTLALGFTLALNFRTGLLGASRFETLFVHVHIAIAGWVLLVMVGVGHRLLPMFMLSHGAPETPAKVAVAAISLGCTLIALPLGTTVHVLGLGSVALGLVAFLTQAVAFYRHRKRPALDPGMRLAMSGLAGLAVALSVAPFAWLRGFGDTRLLTAYVFMLVVGGISLFIAGHYFKIVPFIVWYHRWGARIGREKVPSVADLYSAKAATVALAALVLGVLVTAAGILLGHVVLVRAGALSLFTGACVEGREMIRVVRAKA